MPTSSFLSARTVLLPALLGTLLLAAGCRSMSNTGRSDSPRPIDDEATEETRALFVNLQQEISDAVMYGHQDDLAYGARWRDEPGRSDVQSVAGSYPAVYGWDVGDIGNEGAEKNLDGNSFEKMRGWIEEGYERGGVITISWHMDNPVSGGDSWDTTPAVAELLPGGSHHANYRARLDRFARFANSLDTGFWDWLGFGTAIPVVFRPFHEMSGSWFWWGGDNVDPEDYKQLWRFTVEYLRDEKDVHNLLYAYSTDTISEFEEPNDYYTWYPGDAYVDVMGFDDYNDLQAEGASEQLAEDFRWLVGEANERGKVPAFTETGYEGIPDSTWWTEKLLPALDADDVTRQIAWVLTWRNAQQDQNPGHFFAPYPGQESAADFQRFRDHPLILFEDELPEMYD